MPETDATDIQAKAVQSHRLSGLSRDSPNSLDSLDFPAMGVAQ